MSITQSLSRLAVAAAVVFAASSSWALELVSEAYSRPLPPGQSTAVVYLALKNDGSASEKLVAVSSSVARSAEFHRHIHEGGMMKMRMLPEIELALGKILRFQPGGYHIMLFGVDRPLKVGDRFDLKIDTASGESLKLDVQVKAY